MGVKRFCTLSDGTFQAPCNALKKNLKKLCFEQKRLARMTKFGKNWRKLLEDGVAFTQMRA